MKYEEWRTKLADTYVQSELNRDQADSAFALPLTLEPFDVYDSIKSVYKFVEQFHQTYAKKCQSSSAKANVLYEVCLTENLKIEFADVKSNYPELLKQLKRNYRNAKKVLQKQIQIIKAIEL